MEKGTHKELMEQPICEPAGTDSFCSTYRERVWDLGRQIELAQDAFILLDGEFRFAYVNRKAGELLRRPCPDLLGKGVWQEYQSYTGTEIERQFRHVMRAGTPVQFESYYPDFDTWYEFRVSPSSDGIAVWFRDISVRKRLQQQAEHSAAILDAVMENVPEGMTITNTSTGRIEWVSRYSAQLARRSREDLLNKPITAYGEAWHILRPDGMKPRNEELPTVRAAKGEVVVCEEWLLERGDGVRINVLYNAAPIRDRSGKIVGSVLVWRDITETKAEQERRLESRRLAAVATLAGGVAHNLNSLLTGIIGNISLIIERFDPGDRDRPPVEEALKAAEMAAALARKLLAFGGRSTFTDIKLLNLSEYIRNSEGVIRALIPKQITCDLHLIPNPPSVKVDPEQILEAIVSLITNAVEAIEAAAGRIAVETRVRKLSKEELERMPHGHALHAGNYVSVEVTDSGKGIDPKYRDRIFDPFFSTKFLGRGLGLAVVFGVVRAHGGTVEVHSKPGSGSQFRLYFPVEPPPAEPPACSPAPVANSSTLTESRSAGRKGSES